MTNYKFIVKDGAQSKKLQNVLCLCHIPVDVTSEYKPFFLIMEDGKQTQVTDKLSYFLGANAKLIPLDFLAIFNDDGTPNYECAFNFPYNSNEITTFMKTYLNEIPFLTKPNCDSYSYKDRNIHAYFVDHRKYPLLTFDAFNLLKNYKIPTKEKELKPVNENCLFKPVLVKDNVDDTNHHIIEYEERILTGIMPENLISKYHAAEISLELKSQGLKFCSMLRYRKAKRCPDVVYGDEDV